MQALGADYVRMQSLVLQPGAYGYSWRLSDTQARIRAKTRCCHRILGRSYSLRNLDAPNRPKDRPDRWRFIWYQARHMTS